MRTYTTATGAAIPYQMIRCVIAMATLEIIAGQVNDASSTRVDADFIWRRFNTPTMPRVAVDLALRDLKELRAVTMAADVDGEYVRSFSCRPPLPIPQAFMHAAALGRP